LIIISFLPFFIDNNSTKTHYRSHYPKILSGERAQGVRGVAFLFISLPFFKHADHGLKTAFDISIKLETGLGQAGDPAAGGLEGQTTTCTDTSRTKRPVVREMRSSRGTFTRRRGLFGQKKTGSKPGLFLIFLLDSLFRL
jgi:hypothetical protein